MQVTADKWNAVHDHHKTLSQLCYSLKVKGKGKALGTCYSTAYMSRHKQQCFVISKAAADWRELMIPWCIT